jgi:hypothetical protein
MKKNITRNLTSFGLFLIVLLLMGTPLQGASKFHTFIVKLKNPLHSLRLDQMVTVPVSDINNHINNFDAGKFIIRNNGKSVPFDLIRGNDNNVSIVIQLNFKPDEQKIISFSYSNKKPVFHNNRTRAYLGVKKNYTLKEGVYSGGNFESTEQVVVPKSHFPHDALYQMEGPAWESDKVAYRFYLDVRNRTDIFGKSTGKSVLNIVGKNDLLSGDESYEYPLWWGQDIFKVGNSLGIGTVATYLNGKVITVSETDSIKCTITNHNLYSSVVSDHLGWKVGNNRIDINTDYSIFSGSRLTQVNVKTDNTLENICTGLAKHDSTETLFSENVEGWCYVAIWGKQTICNDHLGIALFYNSNDLIKLAEDNLSRIIVLKPVNNQAKYYFAAAWEKEKNGIKNQEDFKFFLKSTIESLNNPIVVEL